MEFFIARTPVRYHSDAAALFAALGGIESSDAVLLESADIESKKKTKCVAVLNAALRVTCQGAEVHVKALGDTGEAMLKRLGADHDATFRFEASKEHDERARLLDRSQVEILRQLQLDAGYEGEILPFVVGGFAFDFVATFEDLPQVEAGPNTFPDYQFLVAESILTIDHRTQEAAVEAVALSQDAAEAAVDALREAVESVELSEHELGKPEGSLDVRTNISDADFREAVTQLQGNIRQGDIYQVVPARHFTCECPDAYRAYRHLRATNPSPYMFYMRSASDAGPYELFGASPESNLTLEMPSRRVQLYPIAGTRPRGLNPDGSVNHELDIRAELDMRTDAKEVAEHSMLVDLARNDLARVAVPATRKVAELLQVDRYSRVMHLISRIEAELHPDFDALDAYRACMNMGTLTGAPKLRAMELLREVEGVRRGSYGGAVGYLRGDGSMDTCIVIRSAFVQHGTAVVQAGAGVVRDSVPQLEADETLHKAYAVLHAIALAQNKEVEVHK
ncbi:anthranilate synthase component 1 [Corynebacterium gerontici]|uniref:anthranilate synthase n=1 Tax=Corynebacterium gerontici TaxID=2079234 RepID=A0A3G6J397_9CORY|nr:anthranilate synthase component 1 [Corynebacterium gerontici]AZA12409.1 Anthranilate synthase component 1 [Corynebacterium gerontici]